MTGRIIGPPVPVIVPYSDGLAVPKAWLAVAVETDEKKCVPALVSQGVYPIMGATFQLVKNNNISIFPYRIVK